MRIEIVDEFAQPHRIDSQDLDLIGRWFAEKAKILMSADARINHPIRMDIWPSTIEEADLIPSYHQQMKFTEDDLLAFAQHILDVSATLGKRHG